MARPDLRVVEIEERETRLFSREDLFDPRGCSLVLPETRALPAIELKDAQGGVQLRALGLIGYLPLTGQIVLNLRPKFPIDNLWRMLALAEENYDRVLPVLRAYARADASAPHQLLARGFCHYLRTIVDLGLARGYHREPYMGFFKPKVAFGRTVARHLSRGDDLKVSGDVFAFSANLPVNRVLKSACFDFLRLIPRDQKWAAERKLLLEALNALDRVHAVPMAFGQQTLSEAAPRWLRDPYSGALNIYALLLGHTKVGFGYEAQGSELPSFLFSLDTIFESFVRNVFREALRERRIAVLDGNMPRHHGKLFVDNQQFNTKPDLIFRRNGDLLGLAEVKYKPKLGEGDRYQVISHVLAAGCNLGVWISPATAEDSAGLSYVGRMSTGAKFYHYRLDIGGDLDAASTAMVAEVAALLPA